MSILNMLLGVAGVLMTVLIGAMVVMAAAKGMVNRKAKSLEPPDWPGCPKGWVNSKGEFEEAVKSDLWPETRDWQDEIWNLRLPAKVERPQVKQLDSETNLLLLPGVIRGEEGWWVVLLKDQNEK